MLLPQKCTFCAHRVDQTLQPSCVLTCQTNAISFGDLDDPSSDVAKRVVAEPTTASRVWYKAKGVLSQSADRFKSPSIDLLAF